MKIGTVIAEGFAYLTGIILSCGPSQIFGLVKGAIDVARLTSIQSKLSRYSEEAKGVEQLVQRGTQGLDKQNVRLLSKVAKYESRLSEKYRDIKADALALIPFFGAILSWRMYSKEPGYGNAGLFEYAIPQMFGEHTKTFAGLIFYPLAGEEREIKESPNAVKIEVHDASRTRFLDARFYQHDPKQPRETVVISHGNGMTCDDMKDWKDYYFARGYDVLTPTLGGYPGSDTSVRTCEASGCRDIEGIKLFLEKKGVTRAGYHGLSVGGALAFQGAVSPSQSKVQTSFVVADQTFTSGIDAADNAVLNAGGGAIRPLARGAARAAVPVGQEIFLTKKIVVTTDGLNNKEKATQMKKKEIPLFVIKSKQDFLMGKGKPDSHGNFESDFADELLEARYDKEKLAILKESNMAELLGSHSDFFGKYYEATLKLDGFLKRTKRQKK